MQLAYSICGIINLANYNALFPLLDLIIIDYNSLDLLLIMLMIGLPFITLMIDHWLFYSHLDLEIKLIWLTEFIVFAKTLLISNGIR